MEDELPRARERSRDRTSSRLEDEKTPLELIERRIRNLSIWMREHGPDAVEEQAHLREGTRERLYWHYGYLVALKDALQLLERGRAAMN